MKKIMLSAMMLAAMSAYAQDTYTNAEVLADDLAGTARYVGMGGAMEALGAEISTINTNPAGIGLFRRSMATITGSINSLQDCGDNRYGDATVGSIDQAGFVISTKVGYDSYLNYGFSYRKNRNFNTILNVSDMLDGASQNCNSYMNLMDALNLDDWNLSQLDALYYNRLVGDKDGNLYYNTADQYALSRATKGSRAAYDLNVSGNVSNRLYLGFTFGLEDLNYKSWTRYAESLLNGNNQYIGDVVINDQREICGTGFNLKFGGIYFPIEDNAFRIGASIATPTWYTLNTSAATYLDTDAQTGGTPYSKDYYGDSTYDFKMFSPWKFGLSAAHTIDNYIALGASFEYADYAHTRNRILEQRSYYDPNGPTNNDVDMNEHTKATLKGVATLKIGTEVKPTPELAVRLGYNFVSSMYNKDGFRDGTIWSPGTFYSSTTDYTNWKATNRFTCGFGYSKKNISIDLGVIYSKTNGEFHPFMDSSATYVWDEGTDDEFVEKVVNYANPVDVSIKRTQFFGTFTYKF